MNLSITKEEAEKIQNSMRRERENLREGELLKNLTKQSMEKY